MFLARLYRQILLRPRLLAGVLIGMAVVLLLPDRWVAREATRWILGWNAGAWSYLGLAGWMMIHADEDQIHWRADQQDEGARTVLTLAILAAIASLGAIVAELAVAKDLSGPAKLLHIGFAALTLTASWSFMQVSFALHYAHRFFAAVAQGRPGGLVFPGTPRPDYMDFLYFAAVIGTSGQTADVAISSSGMRRIGLVHCVLSFMFNTSLIALMINVASGLF
jgi:uncharacterized membrane protein